MRLHHAIALGIASLVCTSAAGSSAQTAPDRGKPAAAARPAAIAKSALGSADDVTDDASAAARVRFSDGVALAKVRDWQGAHAAFLDAWKLKEHPQIALNLGRAEMELGRYREATTHLQYCIDHTDPADADAALARAWRAEAQSMMAKLTIAVDADGARVLVDDTAVGSAPLGAPVPVDPGKHVVEIRLGDRHVRREISVGKGASLDVTLTLPPERAAEPPPDRTVTDRPSPVRTAVMIGGGAGLLAGVAVGAALGGLALDQQTKRDACLKANDRACWDAAEADRATFARGSLAGFVGGGLLGAGAAAYLVFGPKESSVAVRPAVSLEGASLQITARW